MKNKPMSECLHRMRKEGNLYRCEQCGQGIPGDESVLDQVWCPRERIGYMCKTDFEVELGSANDASGVYSSFLDLQANRPCIRDCGWVLVKLTVLECEEGSL